MEDLHDSVGEFLVAALALQGIDARFAGHVNVVICYTTEPQRHRMLPRGTNDEAQLQLGSLASV